MSIENGQQPTTAIAPSAEIVKSPVLQEAEARALNFLNPVLLASMKDFAGMMITSGAFPKDTNAQKIVVALQAGYEMGLTPMESINSMYFVNGRVSIFGETAIALVKKHGHDVIFSDCDATKATCTIIRKDGQTLSNSLTMAEATERRLNQTWDYNERKWKMKGPWLSAPENMLKFKVFHMTAKFIVPEVFHNVPLKEELDEAESVVLEAENVEGKKKTVSTLEADLQNLDKPAKTKSGKTPKKPSIGRRASVVVEAEEAQMQDEEMPTEPVEPVEEVPEVEESEDDMASRLIDQELEGKVPLTPKEKMFLGSYQARARR